MKRTFRAIAVLMALITGVSYTCLPAISLASEIQNEESKEDFKTRIDKILHPEIYTIPEGNAYIPKGTVINIELTEELSSKKNHVDDDVPLKTLDNIIINDVVVVPAGSLVSGKVTKCTGSGLFGRAGKLEFTINSVKSVNGVEIPLQYTEKREAGSDDGAVAVAAAVSIIGGLFMKGKNVSFPAGSKMTAKVVADTDLKVKIENLAEEMNPTKPHGVVIQLTQ